MIGVIIDNGFCKADLAKVLGTNCLGLTEVMVGVASSWEEIFGSV